MPLDGSPAPGALIACVHFVAGCPQELEDALPDLFLLLDLGDLGKQDGCLEWMNIGPLDTGPTAEHPSDDPLQPRSPDLLELLGRELIPPDLKAFVIVQLGAGCPNNDPVIVEVRTSDGLATTALRHETLLFLGGVLVHAKSTHWGAENRKSSD